jgi:signal transduction histidine kinase
MSAPQILVVEDEHIVALQLRQQLTRLGYDVPSAVSTGDHALRRIETSRPDLVLMDINLKGKLDGITTASRIPPAYGIPVIYLTAYCEDETVSRASATNPYGYLVKPFSTRELNAMIVIALARCHTERTSRAALESRRQAQKMEALRQLAGDVADEFNDLLTVVYSQLEVLGRHTIGEPTLAEPISDTFRAAIEKEELVRRLLAFSGRQKLLPRAVSVRDLVTDATSQIREIVGHTVQMRARLPDDLWPAQIDAGQLARALSNLAVNAREAMPNGGSLTIEGQNTILGQDVAEDRTGGGRYVLLSVADTGSGMPEPVIARAFEPFFTTKPAGGVTGLGLSLVFGFVRQSGGHISIDSNPGSGTTIRIFLPAAPGDSGAIAPPIPVDADPPTPPEPVWAGERERRTEIVSRATNATWRQRDSDHGWHGPSTAAQDHSASPVFWHKAETALFASVPAGPGLLRYRLIVEPLPRRNGWDWAVWRPDDSREASRHGRASSVVSAMAAAEDAARRWDHTGAAGG